MTLFVDDIQVSIEGVKILRGISFEVADRKTTILIGRNGAGKTTTLRAIMGLLTLGHGKVRLDSEHLSNHPVYYRAQIGIGYAPEDRRLVPGISIEENIELPGLALNLGKAEIARRVEEVYTLLPQLRDLRKRPGGGVSGGQGKMVALARALMVSSKVLLLDEPFQGLAPALALDYAKTLGELRTKRPDLALLITESTPSLLNAIADTTLQIERGEVSLAT